MHHVLSGADLAGTLDRVLADGHDLVVVGGGDGTVSYAAGRVVGTNVVLGVLPLGTANDFARTLEIPNNLAEACATVADGKVVDIDLGRANGKPFLNVASAGLSVAVTEALSPRLKRVHGAIGLQHSHASGLCPTQAVSGPPRVPEGRPRADGAQGSASGGNAAHPEEKVTFIELPDSADQQRQQLIQNAQIKSDTFSVLNLDVVWTSEFAANKWIMPRCPRTRSPPDEMIPATVNAATYRDTLVGGPYYTDGALFYFRSTCSRPPASPAPPTTWDEMKTACKAILALPQAAGMSCYAGQFDRNEALTVNFSEAA